MSTHRAYPLPGSAIADVVAAVQRLGPAHRNTLHRAFKGVLSPVAVNQHLQAAVCRGYLVRPSWGVYDVPAGDLPYAAPECGDCDAR